MLAGRAAECATLDRLLGDVQTGRSAVLVLRGEPGIGKTALLAYAAEHAQGCRVLRAIGVESEMELPYAALHQLCVPLLGGLERLPPLQREALGTAFGLSSGAQPDRFLLGLALLSLLSGAAGQQPIVCLIDDAQWLDQSSAQVLAFVARRVQAESVLLLFAEREQGALDELAGLPDLRLEGLTGADARTLLASVITGPLDERVRERIIAETRGNPLALLELPRGLSPAKLSGGFGLPDTIALTSRIELSFLQRLLSLPGDTQRLLVTAAAEPVGDPSLLWRAAAELGIPIEAAAPAEADDLLEIGARVTFRHPLLRSAIYRAASPEERRNAHRALAGATDPEFDPDRRAWHRAQAASAPDEAVAAELERSADRARARGGLAAAAAFLERAAALTPDSAPRAVRAVAAAEAKMQAGAPDAALELLAIAKAGPLDELHRARAERLRAQIVFVQSRGNDAPRLLLLAARRLEPLDPTLARETYLDALHAALQVGDGGTRLEVAEAVGAAAPARPPRAAELLLTGWGRLLSDGFPAGTDLLQRALIAFRSEPLSGDAEIRGLWYACGIARSLWDDESWDLLSARHVQLARDAGALSALPTALEVQAEFEIHAGEFSSAAALLEEADAISEATGCASFNDASTLLAAWRDKESTATDRIGAALREATHKSYGEALSLAEYASAVLHNGLGRHEAALAAAQRSCDHHLLKGFGQVLSELVEAAARSGEPERAAAALEQLSERTRLGGNDWALGIEARSRALLSEGEAAEDLYGEALDRLGRTRVRTALARAHLLYGEWLRRENRRLDAREQLRTAHDMLSSIGAEAFAERAARELRATGENVRKRRAETRRQLTAQETQIARLAADGHSNPEIGAQLFLSPRTIEYHLHKVFTALAITSRTELPHVLSGREDTPDTTRDSTRQATRAP
jgi:DNA-binding CsgD family transcriptional regulator